MHLDPVEQFIAAAVGARLNGEAFDPYGMPVVVAARGLIADTLAQLPLVTIRGRRPLPTQPQLTLRPNRLEPRWLTFHRAANNLTRYGYVWFRVTDWDAAGRATAVRCIDALDATADWDPVTGELDTVWQNGDELVPGLEIVWVPYNVERRASYGDLTAKAATLTPPANAPLKDPKDFKLIGTRVPGVDNQKVVTGRDFQNLSSPPRQ